MGTFIRLHSGKTYDFAAPDIAHALSNICRYAGHVPKFYPVAEHCVRVSAGLETEAKRSEDIPF